MSGCSTRSLEQRNIINTTYTNATVSCGAHEGDWSVASGRYDWRQERSQNKGSLVIFHLTSHISC